MSRRAWVLSAVAAVGLVIVAIGEVAFNGHTGDRVGLLGMLLVLIATLQAIFPYFKTPDRR